MMNNDERLALYELLYGHILFPGAAPGSDEWHTRREVQANPAGQYMYSYDGLTWKEVPMDTGKISFADALLREIPPGVILGVKAAVQREPSLYEYSRDNGHTWTRLDQEANHTWIYHGKHETTWFRKID